MVNQSCQDTHMRACMLVRLFADLGAPILTQYHDASLQEGGFFFLIGYLGPWEKPQEQNTEFSMWRALGRATYACWLL